MNSMAYNIRKVFVAMVKNKMRFADGMSKQKKRVYMLLIALLYVVVSSVISVLTVIVGKSLHSIGMEAFAFFIILMTAAVVVLIYGVINIIATLFTSKDNAFYAALPVRSVSVFIAKMLFVYVSEAAIVAVVVLPGIIAFGIAVKAWAGYYIISILTLPIVPALPLMVAAIVSIPVMSIANRLKKRTVMPLILYCVVFFTFFIVYFYIFYSSSSFGTGELTQEKVNAILRSIDIMTYAMYPYTMLAEAALGKCDFGLDLSHSIAAELGIFVGISVVITAVLLLLGRLMYGRITRDSNQMSGAIRSKGHKANTLKHALIKREYIIAMRNPSTAFLCFGVMLFPIFFALIFDNVIKGLILNIDDRVIALSSVYMSVMVFSVLSVIIPSIANGAITSFSREGKAITTLKVMPVDAKTVVRAKVSFWSSILVPISVISAIIVNIFDFNLLQFFLSLILFAVLPFVFIVFGVLWDLVSPKLKWTDPVQSIKNNTHSTFGKAICIGASFLTTIAITLTFFMGGSDKTVFAVFWLSSFAVLLFVAFADVFMYNKVNKYYNRLWV